MKTVEKVKEVKNEEIISGKDNKFLVTFETCILFGTKMIYRLSELSRKAVQVMNEIGYV